MYTFSVGIPFELNQIMQNFCSENIKLVSLRDNLHQFRAFLAHYSRQEVQNIFDLINFFLVCLNRSNIILLLFWINSFYWFFSFYTLINFHSIFIRILINYEVVEHMSVLSSKLEYRSVVWHNFEAVILVDQWPVNCIELMAKDIALQKFTHLNPFLYKVQEVFLK